MRWTIGTRTPRSFTRRDALRSTSQRKMPPKMLMNSAFDVLVGHQDAERVLDLLGVGAAADVEESSPARRPPA
jgi:hypothetical protein